MTELEVFTPNESVLQTPEATNALHITTCLMNNIRKPKPKYDLTAVLPEVEPESHIQALKDKKWRKAMSIEYNVFAWNDTFDLVDHSLAKKYCWL